VGEAWDSEEYLPKVGVVQHFRWIEEPITKDEVLGMRDFIEVSSTFYPQLGSYYEQEHQLWVEKLLARAK
jgi:hypothetical protein